MEGQEPMPSQCRGEVGTSALSALQFLVVTSLPSVASLPKSPLTMEVNL